MAEVYMRTGSVLALIAAASAARTLPPIRSGFVKSAFKPPDVFEGVHRPEGASNTVLEAIRDLSLDTNARVIGFTVGASGFKNLIGEAKTQATFDSITSGLERRMTGQGGKLGIEPAIDGYKIWGNDRYDTMLMMLLKTNPFMASALTPAANGGFELKAFDPSEPNPSLFLKLMRTLTVKGADGSGGFVNFKFNAAMDAIESFSAFDPATGKQISETDARHWASAAIYNLLFYASGIHATIHVLHFMYTDALSCTSKGFPALNTLAETWDNNIRLKYREVYALLINSDPAKADAAITGTDGFGSSVVTHDILKDELLYWARCKSMDEWLDRIFPKEVRQSPALLSEFKKHCDLVPTFAKECSDTLKGVNAAQLAASEKSLAQYLGACGDFGKAPCACAIGSLKSWIEIMSVTGIFHGSTLSYTRLFVKADVIAWRKPKADRFDAGDDQLVRTALGTIVGMQSGRYVMGSKLYGFIERRLAPILNRFGYSKFDPALAKALDAYDAKSSELKAAYEASICRDEVTLRDYGFILSDFCTDTFDGKQLTIATYI
jgi:hypothetical protein